jgi:hypothetical protein
VTDVDIEGLRFNLASTSDGVRVLGLGFRVLGFRV